MLCKEDSKIFELYVSIAPLLFDTNIKYDYHLFKDYLKIKAGRSVFIIDEFIEDEYLYSGIFLDWSKSLAIELKCKNTKEVLDAWQNLTK